MADRPDAVIIGDDDYARAGLRAALEAAGLHVVDDRAPDEPELLDLDPGVTIVDGVDALPTSLLRPLALVHDEDGARRALASGAVGALLRTAPPSQIVEAARAVAAGLVVVDASFASLVSATLPPGEMPSGEKLTDREREVLELLAEGLSNREIAERLEVSVHTAKFHVNAILNKLGAQTRTEAVVLAARLGLISL